MVNAFTSEHGWQFNGRAERTLQRNILVPLLKELSTLFLPISFLSFDLIQKLLHLNMILLS